MPRALCRRSDLERIEREIVAPTFRGMAEEGLVVPGVLFFGVMLTAEGPKLLEYNVRFGDPETQSLLPLLESNIAELCASGVAKGALCSLRPRFSDRTACGVVVAAPGYPGPYPKGLRVDLGGPKSGDCVAFPCVYDARSRRQRPDRRRPMLYCGRLRRELGRRPRPGL
jgi:phosphoribosylamine--glycine ligase